MFLFETQAGLEFRDNFSGDLWAPAPRNSTSPFTTVHKIGLLEKITVEAPQFHMNIA